MMNKHILLDTSGGIAAYKFCELVRRLEKAGYSVTVVMSRSAAEFASPLAFQALSGSPALSNAHGGEGTGKNGMTHINLTHRTDVLLIAPVTANTVAKTANGVADSLLTNLAVARKCPLVVAPVMNVEMWFNPANQCSIRQLASDGVTVFQSDSEEQACGETGAGRMPEAVELAGLLPDLWIPKILNDKKVLTTAGVTFETIDPVRGITNISSGRMGMAFAAACRAAGAQVTSVCGQLQTAVPAGLVHTVRAVSVEEMYRMVHDCIASQDVFILVAAVADYEVKNSSNQKLKKGGTGMPPAIELVKDPDILAPVAALPSLPLCIGFVAESENVLGHIRVRRLKKNVPILVASQVSQVMGRATNQITIIDDRQETSFPKSDKRRAAEEIVRRLAELLG